MSTPAEDIRDWLVTTKSVSEEVKIGGLDEDANVMIAVISSGGSAPELAMGDGNVIERQSSLQILIRGAKNGHGALLTLAETIYGYMAFAIDVSSNSNTYDKIVATGDLLHLGEDGSGRPMYSFSVEAWKRGV